jgi:phosphoglycerate dehydrogenase-like enzyme
MTNVLVLLGVPESIRAIYAKALTDAFPQLTVRTVDHRSKAQEFIGETDVLMTFGPLVSRQLIESASKLRWIQSLGAGVDGLADHPSLRDDVIVTRIKGVVAPVSEMVVGALLALSRDMRRSFENQSRKVWERYPARLLSGKTVGILGVGAISEALAPKCAALGMNVIGLSSAPRTAPGFAEILPISELKSAVGRLDYLVILTPYTPATHHIVDAAVLAGMKPSSYLINVARGGVVDEQALIAALNRKQIAGAALDVFQEEPLPPEHPFWTMPNVIVTPHLGGLCDVYPDLVLPTVLENMRCYLNGEFGRMLNRVALLKPA